jgi:hypothetical protein
MGRPPGQRGILGRGLRGGGREAALLAHAEFESNSTRNSSLPGEGLQVGPGTFKKNTRHTTFFLPVLRRTGGFWQSEIGCDSLGCGVTNT